MRHQSVGGALLLLSTPGCRNPRLFEDGLSSGACVLDVSNKVRSATQPHAAPTNEVIGRGVPGGRAKSSRRVSSILLCYVMLWCPFNTPASAVGVGGGGFMRHPPVRGALLPLSTSKQGVLIHHERVVSTLGLLVKNIIIRKTP
jgi:hypothetical protein